MNRIHGLFATRNDSLNIFSLKFVSCKDLIFIVAIEISNPYHNSWLSKVSWFMALLFGFLHGLGFAGALTAVGLPDGEIPLVLFSFNIGIESGQLLFVVVIQILWYLFKKMEFQVIVVKSLIPAAYSGPT